jgi:hypothetical protein
MTKADSPLQPDPKNGRTSRLPWILGLLAVSALMHLVAINWFTGAISMTLPESPTNPVINATLVTPPKVIPVSPVAKPASKPKPKQRARPPPPESNTATTQSVGPSTAGVDDIASNAASDVAPEPVEVVPQPVEVAKPDPASYKINLPPSAMLKYDVQKTAREGQPMYGHGSIGWQTDGTHYSVDGEAGVLFFTVLNFKSEGTIDANGIAPETYSEKRFRRAETATHFHRERNTISFSSSTKSYPRKGGEQDRASVIWQLAGIGRGDHEKFSPGAQIDLIVAGTRDADTWSMVVVGQEEIRIAGETIQAWHVTRLPRAGSHDQKLDIWLAPRQNWYPVRLRYTETNGDFLDMSLTSLNISPTPLSDP